MNVLIVCGCTDSYYGFNMQLNPETGEWEEPPPQPSGSGGSHQDKKLPQPSASYSCKQLN